MSLNEHLYELETMEDFLEYDEKDLHGDEVMIMDDIIHKASRYLDHDDIRKIQKAYIYAADAHKEQKRLSGEDYITHPLRATQFLLTIKPDIQTIQACILHDVIEDTPITYDDIQKEFGQEVATLCEWLVKVSKVRYQWEDRQIETLKKTFLAMAQDLRVIFIKLADRMHNIQTLRFHPKEEKRIRIAMETMKIYVPLCKKLWLYQFQIYLENGVFKILHPDEYRQVIHYLKKNYTNADKYISKWIMRIGKLLKDAGMQHYNINGRVKSPYRIYEKLIKKYQTLDFSKVLDVIAFRVIADTVPDCYNALGVIHSHFNPLINKIKDYIAVPKFNNYQSLHTTILGLFPFPVEIQIRTKPMNDIAEYGVAAHHIYKGDETGKKSLTEQQSNWLQKIHDSVTAYDTTEKSDHEYRHEHFTNTLAIELLDNNIFVYTPKGHVIEMSKWSTVLDFAFRVHTDMGLKFNNALVNGIIKPIGHILSTGDVVTINAYKNRYTATKYRTDYLHTPTAKSKLQRHLKQQEKDIYLTQAIAILNAKLTKYELPLVTSDKDQMRKHFGAWREGLLLQIANKAVSATQLIKEVYHITPRNDQSEKVKSDKIPSSDHSKGQSETVAWAVTQTTPPSLWGAVTTIIIDDQPSVPYELCPVCHPQPWDKIIAKTGRDGIKIHTLQCKALSTVSYDKLIKAYRSSIGKDAVNKIVIHTIGNTQPYNLTLWIRIPSDGASLISLLTVFQELNVHMDSTTIDKRDDETYAITIQSPYDNPSKIAYILRYLDKNYPHILSLKKSLS